MRRVFQIWLTLSAITSCTSVVETLAIKGDPADTDDVTAPFSGKRLVFATDNLNRLFQVEFKYYISFPAKTDVWGHLELDWIGTSGSSMRGANDDEALEVYRGANRLRAAFNRVVQDVAV